MFPISYGTDLLAQVMTAAGLRHRVIAQNVANVNTPGYKRLEVRFEDELTKSLAGGGPAKPAVVRADGPERVDGNTVDIDREMGDMNKNALLYQAAAQVASFRLAALRSSITGR